jgi:hypothetical protein
MAGAIRNSFFFLEVIDGDEGPVVGLVPLTENLYYAHGFEECG